MSALFLRHAFSDFSSLTELERGRLPSADDLKRRLFVLERRYDPARPDHFYHAYLKDRFGSANQIGDFPTLALRAMVDRFLEKRRGRIVVRQDVFAEWQNAIGALSPLALLVYAIVNDPERTFQPGADPALFLANVMGNTACLSPFLPALDDLIEQEGLYDAHVHLNGSTEVDVVWADAVMRPNAYLSIFKQSFAAKSAVRELYDQIEPGLTARRVFKRLRSVRRIRHILATEIRRAEEGEKLEFSVDELLDALRPDRIDADVANRPARLARSPYFTLFPNGTAVGPLAAEAGFLFTCFDATSRHPALSPLIGLMLWYNFTVFSQVARLTVQQIDQTGFHQFDKFTAAGARDSVEHIYEARFGQLNGNAPRGDLSYLEGRFAPKASPDRTGELIARIVDGVLAFRKCPQRKAVRALSAPPPACLRGPCSCPQRTDRMDLALVAHFVKKADHVPHFKDDGSLSSVAHGRHVSHRKALRKQYRSLRYVLDRSEIARTLVRGIDGAGNELDAPPEIFAPTFRALRDSGDVTGASFHVGEDFIHLASGVRSIEEAVRFLGLGTGDRVGHAVALGVEPKTWTARIGDRILMTDEDRLDDAVYASTALRDRGERFPEEARLQASIDVLSNRIYGTRESASDLERAWALRDLDILTVLAMEQDFEGSPADMIAFAKHATARANEFVDRDQRREARRIASAVTDDPRAFSLYRRRHAPDVRARGALYGECRVLPGRGVPSDFSEPVLEALQAHGLDILRRHGVVIETLPTSNVRIGGYRDYSEHHLMRWLGVSGSPVPVAPEVCVGSDDPGIFSTNARNEFGHVLLALEKEMSPREAADRLRRLNQTGRMTRFAYAPTAKRSWR